MGWSRQDGYLKIKNGIGVDTEKTQGSRNGHRDHRTKDVGKSLACLSPWAGVVCETEIARLGSNGTSTEQSEGSDEGQLELHLYDGEISTQ